MLALATTPHRTSPEAGGDAPPHVDARAARQRRRLEVRRLRRHFARVLEILRARDVGELDAPARGARGLHLAHLEAYALRGRFPKNRDFPGVRMPYFVDADGTRCAMAHLIDGSGAHELVQRVAATANHAFVPELAGDAALAEWLRREGFALEEAALIQPAYCSTFAQDCLCDGLDGVAEAMLEEIAGGQLTARVTAVYGEVTHVVGDAVIIDGYPDATLGDQMIIAGDSGSILAHLSADGASVDTSDCFSMNGTPPESAPKDAAIASMIGAFDTCGDGLGPEWTSRQGLGCGSASSSSVSGTGVGGASAGSSGGQGASSGGGAGGTGTQGDASEDGCSVTTPRGGSGSLGALLLGAAFAGALHLRTRRYRPRR